MIDKRSMKHIYLHTSKKANFQEITTNEKVENVHEYDIWDYARCEENEYGRIKTRTNHFHILIGAIRQENCPWCGNRAILRRISEGDTFRPSIYSMICEQCCSRGPNLCVNISIEENKRSMEEVEALMKDRYEHRRQWDDDFINPYEL
jgi:hypothetical protein